jgi:predicted dehydrogenase
MLETERPDVLHVATPTESHCVLIAEAARRGVPLIICEKPLCSKAEEAREALAACREYGATLMVNHERRYSRDYVHARELVRERRYGALLSIQARLYMGRDRRPAEILLEDGTHMVDVIRFLTGEEIETRCTEGNPHEETGTLQVLFRCGEAAGFWEVSGRHQALVFEIELGFELGRLRIGNGILELWESAPSRHYAGFDSLRQVRVPRFRTTGYFAGMLADAVEVARNPDRAPVSAGEDGLRALEVIEQMLATEN